MAPARSGQGDLESTQPSGPAAPAPARPLFRIGPYPVLGQIGRGAMGLVYAAYDEKLDRKIALKLLHSLQDPGTLGAARLLREAQSLARASHPNVVQVYEVGSTRTRSSSPWSLSAAPRCAAWGSTSRARITGPRTLPPFS